MPLPRLSTLAAAIMLALFASMPPVSAQSVVVLVNGEPITSLDIEQRTKLIFLTTHKQAKRDEVLNELIDEKVKLREGKKFGVDPGSVRRPAAPHVSRGGDVLGSKTACLRESLRNAVQTS